MSKDANEILESAEQEVEEIYEHVRDVANYFHDHEGELFPRDEAIDAVSEEYGLNTRLAHDVIAELTGDVVDPVIQVEKDGEDYIGVVEYVEREGCYGYIDYHDTYGKRKRMVCAECVHKYTYDHQVAHATNKDPHGSFPEGDASYDDLAAKVREHYETDHEGVTPDEVETGADLISSTTMGGSQAWHKGNHGKTSGLIADTSGYSDNSDQVDGYHASNVPGMPEPIYGDGSDGSITHSANVTYSRTYFCTDYTLQSGNTASLGNDVVIIVAQNKITINGTIDGKGMGGSRTGPNGSNGNNGLFVPNGSGGAGGSSNRFEGGDGGSGNGGSPLSWRDRFKISPFAELRKINDITTAFGGASGGSGGLGESGNVDKAHGGDGSAPGGAGGGATDPDASADGNGGAGGAGGGAVFLIAPEIEINGTIDLRGDDGEMAETAPVTGGGGGGGSGGAVWLIGRQFSESNATYNLSGGAGAPVQEADRVYDGGAGANGASGDVFRVTT